MAQILLPRPEDIPGTHNSDDDTYSKAKEYLEKSTSKVPVYVVNINFDEGERGVGSARRFGTDLELYRMYLREAGAIKECYFVGGDADEQIPQNHLECIVNTFRESQADLLLGEFGYNRPFGPFSGFCLSAACMHLIIFSDSLCAGNTRLRTQSSFIGVPIKSL